MYKAWRWPRNWLPKGHRQFWCKLIGFSVLGHLSILFFGFFYHKSDNHKLIIFSKPRSIDVVVVPFYKKIPNAQKMINEARKVSPKKGKTLPKAVLQKDVLKKTEIAPAVIKKNKIEPKKSEIKKIVAKKEVKKVIPKKSDKILPSAPVKKNEPIIKPLPVAPVLQERPSESNEPIYIGRGDLQNMQMAQELEAVIIKSWQPPMGFAPDTECVVELVVDGNGKVVNFVIKKSSKITVYDLSVRRIFTQIVMPASVRNKTLTIVFRQ